jgi:glycerophosphoryl diester phosphodiesterase
VPNRPSIPAAVGSAAAPLVVAHRAGNALDRLRASEAAGLAFAEADVHLFRGRLEVRHFKTVGPLPLFWDRWELAPPWRPRLLLDEVLAAAAPSTELMIDLKGRRPRLAELVAEAVAPYLGQRRLTVSSRCWPLLEPFAELPVRRLHSVGSARQLRALVRQFPGARLDGVAIHERLLDLAALAELRRIAAVVMTWPVNDAGRAAELLGLGVDGLISDRPEAITAAFATEAAA